MAGFVFPTTSRKGRELSEPHATLLFPWLALGGKSSSRVRNRVPREESELFTLTARQPLARGSRSRVDHLRRAVLGKA